MSLAPCFRCNAPDAVCTTGQCLQCVADACEKNPPTADILKQYAKHINLLEMCTYCKRPDVVGISLLPSCKDCNTGQICIFPFADKPSSNCAMCYENRAEVDIKICLHCYVQKSATPSRLKHLRETFTRVVGCLSCTHVKGRNPYTPHPGFCGLLVCKQCQ